MFGRYLINALSTCHLFFCRWMRGFLTPCLVFLLSMSSFPLAHSAEVLVVGTEFAQIFERDASGEFSGLGVELIRAMAKQSGDTVTFQIYPWARAQLMVETNQAQILVGPYKTVEREAKFSFASKAFYRDDMVFYVKKKADLHWNGNYQSLHGKTIGLINGWVYGKQFEANRSALKAEMVYSLTSGLKMLLADRFDFLASNVRNTESMAKTLGLTNEILALVPIIDNENGYLAYCKTALCDSLRMRFDEIFERMRVSGELGKLAQYYNVRLP
jgi:polar amino acid transport system substrate-binding protein